MSAKSPASFDEYIASQPLNARQLLSEIRAAIHAVVPDATEAISYGIPTYQINGKNMVHFAASPHHIGLYATPDGHVAFEQELSKYKRGKGSVQFPIDEPLPMELIERIALFRADELRKGE